MKNRSRTKHLIAGAGILAVCATVITAAPLTAQPNRNMLQLLEESGRFETLLALLDAADLTAAVETGRPLTLLAPNDDAFAALDPALVDAVLADPDGLLKDVLLYHVIAGWRNISELQRWTTAETLNGKPVIVRDLTDRERSNLQSRRAARTPHVNDARVLRRNWRATNGIIHELGAVLIPPDSPAEVTSLVDVLALDGRFTTLIAAVQAAGLAGALSGADELTVFAPTDAAFEKLGVDVVETLLAEPGLTTLETVLLYHVAAGSQSLGDLLTAGEVETLQGGSVTMTTRRGAYVENSKIVNADLNAPNGVIHAIDAVLLP
jgi:uncharacterized surface protein with fasciclin (FAS1) repeats